MLFSLAHDQPYHEAHADRAGQGRQERQNVLHVSHSSKALFDFGSTLDYSIGDNDTIVKGTIVDSIRAADLPFAWEAGLFMQLDKASSVRGLQGATGFHSLEGLLAHRNGIPQHQFER